MENKQIEEAFKNQTKEVNVLKRTITKLVNELNKHENISVSATNWKKEKEDFQAKAD